jgi:hypothetical protein
MNPGILKETAPTGVEHAWVKCNMHERDLANLFSDLTFEKRLSLIFEGFCPYCEVALGERVPFGTGVRPRCPCCGGLFRTFTREKEGPCWHSIYGHDCPHTSGAWASDEHPYRTRLEFRDKRVLNQAGRLVYFLR